MVLFMQLQFACQPHFAYLLVCQPLAFTPLIQQAWAPPFHTMLCALQHVKTRPVAIGCDPIKHLSVLAPQQVDIPAPATTRSILLA
jgi:hypothetical protein